MNATIKYILGFLLSLFSISLSSQSYSDLFFQAAGSPMNPKVQVSWNRFNTNAGIEKICRDIAKAWPQLAKLESIGKSVGGNWKALANRSEDEISGY